MHTLPDLAAGLPDVHPVQRQTAPYHPASSINCVTRITRRTHTAHHSAPRRTTTHRPTSMTTTPHHLAWCRTTAQLPVPARTTQHHFPNSSNHHTPLRAIPHNPELHRIDQISHLSPRTSECHPALSCTILHHLAPIRTTATAVDEVGARYWITEIWPACPMRSKTSDPVARKDQSHQTHRPDEIKHAAAVATLNDDVEQTSNDTS